MGRTSNSIKNTLNGFMLQGVTAVLSFVTRSAMISALGIESVAINGLFTEVISALSLAELGVGSAIVYNLYKPLAEKDYRKVNQLMNLFRQAYTIIAIATMAIGVILCPWIQNLVNGMDYDIWYLRLVYLLFVFQSSSSYLFAYKASLLNADQNSRVVSRITALIKLLGTVLQIVILYTTHRYICFLIVSIAITLSTNIIVSHKVDTMYPFLKKGENLEREEKKKVFSNIKNIFFKELAGKVVDSTDNMLISVLVSTVLVGFYANYLSVITVIKGMGVQVSSGIYASLGNLFASESAEKCEEILKHLEYLFRRISMLLAICTFGCIQIFISLWIGERYLLQADIVLWCCINMYCSLAILPLSNAMHMIGRFDIGRNISICSALVNIVLSFILGKSLGMTGIFIGTFSTFFLEFFAKNYFLYKLFFKKSPLSTIVQGTLVFAETVGIFILEYWGITHLEINPSILSFIICGLVCAVFSFLIILITSFRSESFRYWFGFGKRLLKK